MTADRVTRVDDLVQVRNVVVSCSDKAGLDVLAGNLVDSCPGVRFYATGGTFSFLREALGEAHRQRAVDITRYTTRPVTHSGLARTTDFKLYLGLLADPWNQVHVMDVSASGSVFFDMVVSNMLPFPDAAEEADLAPEEARLRLDIGGPGMLRAGARNFVRVAVVADPADYERVAARVTANGGKTDLALRIELASRAFEITTRNDDRVARFFASLEADRVRAAYPKE